MKTKLLLSVVAVSSLVSSLVGCIASEGTVYDVQETKRAPSNQATAVDPTPPSGMDASVCTVQGRASIAGGAFAAKDAIEVFDATKGTFSFLLTDYANACTSAGAAHAGANVLAIEYKNTALAAGTYDVTKTPGLTAAITTYGAGCKASAVTAESGNIVFDKLDDCGGEGSIDVVIGSEHVTATFTASVCAVPNNASACE